jgi:hypothetical protein
MGFKFLAFEYEYIKEPSSPKYRKMIEVEDASRHERKVIKSVQYQYWIDNFNFITCTLTISPAMCTIDDKSKLQKTPALLLNQSTISVKYMIYAPKDTLNTIRKSANAVGKRNADNPEDSLYKRVSALVQLIYKRENQFKLLDSICAQLQRAAVIFNTGQTQSKDKYKQQNTAKIATKQLPNLHF